jgi:MFS family permease
MGRLSDKYGTRNLTTIGALLLIAATAIFLTMTINSTLYIVIVGSAVSGVGASMFFPANFNAAMSNARPGAYGSISGLLRTLQNIGLLGSFVLAISIASATIPRSVAFQVFIGTTNLSGSISQQFLGGIHSAYYSSIVLLLIAAIIAYTAGEDAWRQKAPVTTKTP